MENSKENTSFNLGKAPDEPKKTQEIDVKKEVQPQPEPKKEQNPEWPVPLKTNEKDESGLPYIVRITVPALNVRVRPEKTAKILSVLTDQTEDLMITAESGALGELTWGKVDGGGWVQLGFIEKII